MNRRFDHAAIEKKWRARHEHERLYQADVAAAKNKYYVLDMFPYPSGHGLHVGHWRGYILSDFFARYARLQGKTVLHPMGFDSFGLPAENAAIKYKSQPKKFTDQAIKSIRPQLEQMGSSFDWSKYLSTCDPNYYRWTQWLFLQFFKHGLAEKRLSLVNWCPKDQTVLANEQVVNGCCERCGSAVTKKELSQWYIKSTEFAQELLDDLQTVAWPERVKSLQRDWIGRSEGVTVIFDSPAGSIEVFTTRVDTIYGVTALILAPEHPLVAELTAKSEKSAVSQYLKEIMSKTDVARQQGWEKEKSAVFTGQFAKHPLTGKDIPIWIADYVLMSYGTGAVMSVPAHDERDYQFAKKYDLPITQVVAPRLLQDTEPAKYRPEEPTINGESVIVFIQHPKDDKYLGLNWTEDAWGAKTLLTGTIDDLSPEATVIKEIKEETGYLNLGTPKLLGVIDGLFYHLPKKTNKLVRGHVYLVRLKDEKKEKIEEHEQKRHELLWKTKAELKGFLTPATHQFALDWLENGWQPFTDFGATVNSGEYDNLTSTEAVEKIINELTKKGRGKKKTIYRLRDWLVSRQRYWGPPIPIVYDPVGQPHAVKEEYLPLLLPEDVDFLPGGESPIKRSQEFAARAEKLYGKGWSFETDTLDTFVDSSWYFLRYLSPNDDTQAFDPELVKKWLPVDLYVGGIEHATLHLLYARMVVKFLATYGYIDRSIIEPFKELFSIGSITMHGAKMSKSKGNVVSPDLLVEHYGTDALRGYELFIGPLDVEADWTNRGINGIHRFLIKLYQLAGTAIDEERMDAAAALADYLAKIGPMIEQYRLNTMIAEAMKFTTGTLTQGAPKEVWEQFLVTLSPIFPYLTEEIWSEFGHTQSIFTATWPKTVKRVTVSELKVLVNQKYVVSLSVKGKALDQTAVVALAKQEKAVVERLKGKKVKSVIYRPNQLLNFVVDA